MKKIVTAIATTIIASQCFASNVTAAAQETSHHLNQAGQATSGMGQGAWENTKHGTKAAANETSDVVQNAFENTKKSAHTAAENTKDAISPEGPAEHAGKKIDSAFS